MGYKTFFNINMKRGAKAQATILDVIRRIAEVTEYDWDYFHEAYSLSTCIIAEFDDECENITKANEAILEKCPINDETKVQLEGFDAYYWYDWEEDMTAISKEFPDYEFIVEGRGEDRGDWWIAYFHNGAMQIRYAKIVSPWDSFENDDHAAPEIKETVKQFGKWASQ